MILSFDGEAPERFDAKPFIGPQFDTFFFGGSCTGDGNFEGRLDEIAVFDRALSVEEITGLFQKGTAN
jgi:hypothetical protein